IAAPPAALGSRPDAVHDPESEERMVSTVTETAQKPKTLIEAITEAMYEEMEADERVFCIGEDIGFYGGVFKATKGLWERFGADRVIDSPLSESMIVGAGVGAALVGMRPIPEIQFADFITCGIDQIVDQAALIC